MTETIDFKLTLDATGANRALDDTRRRAEALGGAKESLGKQLTGMKERLEKSAGAYAALSLAMGNTGDTSGKVLSSVGQLAAAYGAGRPLALALAVGAAGVSALNKHWDDLIKKQDEAIEKQYALAGALAAAGRGVRAQLEATDTALQVRRLGYDPSTGTITGVNARYAPQIAEAEKNLEKARNARLEDYSVQSTKLYNDQVTIATRTLAQLNQARRNEIDLIKQGSREEAEAARAAAAAKVLAAEKRWQAGLTDARVADYLANRPDEDANRGVGLSGGFSSSLAGTGVGTGGSSVRSAGAVSKERQAVMKDLEWREKAWLATNMFMRNVWADTQSEMLVAGQGTYVGLLGSFQGYIDAKITGQKEAEAMLAAAALKAIGDQLVGFGTQQIFKGVGYMIESGGFDPRGAGLIALGTLATGAGVGMGAASAGIAHGAATRIDAAEAADKEAARTSGIGGSRGGRGSNYGGGGTNITIVYGGASGPSADDGARAVVGALRRADRRGFIQPRVL